jgi:hypothetical protein
MAQSQSWCGTQTLYFQNNESTSPTGYEELINYPSGNTEKDESVTIKNTNGPVLIDNYIIPEGSMVNTIELEQGLRRYRYYAYVDSAVGVSQLNFTAFKRFSNGTEINFYTAMSGDIDSLTVTEYNLNYVSQNNLPIGPQDRLGIRVTANTTHSSLVTIHWVYQGSIHTSHFESGYFVCEEPATQNYAANYAEQEPISPFIPMAAVIFSMIAIAAYNNRRREE